MSQDSTIKATKNDSTYSKCDHWFKPHFHTVLNQKKDKQEKYPKKVVNDNSPNPLPNPWVNYLENIDNPHKIIKENNARIDGILEFLSSIWS